MNHIDTMSTTLVSLFEKTGNFCGNRLTHWIDRNYIELNALITICMGYMRDFVHVDDSLRVQLLVFFWESTVKTRPQYHVIIFEDSETRFDWVENAVERLVNEKAFQTIVKKIGLNVQPDFLYAIFHRCVGPD